MNDLKLICEKVLKEAEKSTRVVSWYAHPKEVRGPFHRWFTCSDVSQEYRKDVAEIEDDCRFSATAMNSAERLAKAVIVLSDALCFIACNDKEKYGNFGFWKNESHETCATAVADDTLTAREALTKANEIAREG